MPLSKNGTHTLKVLLRRLAKNDRLTGSAQFLAILFLAYIEGHDWVLDIIKCQFGSSSRVRWSKIEENVDEPGDNLNKEAREALKSIFGEIETLEEKKNAGSADSNSTS
jgi:hypothetical protein